MPRLHRVTVGGEGFFAKSGERLLDAAIMNGVSLPNDCRAGRCGACMVRICSGVTLGGQSRQRGCVHACMALVFSDLVLEVERVPAPSSVKGRIVHIAEIASDIVSCVIRPSHPLTILPGQFCKLRFRGYPSRAFSPTAALTDIRDDGLLRFHIKRIRDGFVTPHLGTAIDEGHHVVVDGPYGHAYLRPRESKRLVLVASGTGFAPAWAIAAAALAENPLRSVVLIAATRQPSTFYMAPALDLASRFRNVISIPCIEELTRAHGRIVPGSADRNLPRLTCEDVVYAAGGPKTVDAIADLAQAAGATFYADPFEVIPNAPSWIAGANFWIARALHI